MAPALLFSTAAETALGKSTRSAAERFMALREAAAAKASSVFPDAERKERRCQHGCCVIPFFTTPPGAGDAGFVKRVLFSPLSPARSRRSLSPACLSIHGCRV